MTSPSPHRRSKAVINRQEKIGVHNNIAMAFCLYYHSHLAFTKLGFETSPEWSSGNLAYPLLIFNSSAEVVSSILAKSRILYYFFFRGGKRESMIRRYFQHAHLIPILGVGKRGEY